MSLINEALRKAQSQRTQAPGLGSSSDAGNPLPPYAGGSNRYGLMVGLGICIIILFGLVAGLAFILLSKGTAQKTQQATDEAGTPSAEVATKITETTEPESETPLPETSEPETEVIEEPVVQHVPNPEIVDWLAQSKITGVRITASSSKVILNNEAFVPGDSVNMSLSLKIFEIEPERILFIDSNGVKYVKML